MVEKKKDVLQPMGDASRQLAKSLLRSARYAALATLDAADGSPSASRISIATAMNGDPVFLISRLSGHFGNLEADQRCSVLVGEPGKGDPLAHPRMTIIGRAQMLVAGDVRDQIKSRYLQRHSKSALYVDFPDFAFWRVSPVRISLNGGFGKAFAPTPEDLITVMPEMDQLEAAEAGAVAHMNSDHAAAVDRYAGLVGATGTGWQLGCIDPEGLDLVRGDDVARLWFDAPLVAASGLRPALVALASR